MVQAAGVRETWCRTLPLALQSDKLLSLTSGPDVAKERIRVAPTTSSFEKWAIFMGNSSH